MRPWNRGIRLPARPPAEPVELPVQERLTIPLERGETALVRVGERVRLGQRIADGAGEMVPLHAGASGFVTAIAPRTCADGKRYPAIVIENDGENRPDPAVQPRVLLDELSQETLLGILFEAGIRLPDGTPLATAAADAAQKTQTLLISAMDPEPWLYGEDAVVRTEAEAALSGIRILERLIGPQQVVVAAAARQKEAVRVIERWRGKRLRPEVLPDTYPMGHPQQLAALFGENTVVIPISAAAECGRSVYEGMPAVSRLVSVEWGTGRAVCRVPLGAPVGAVLKAVGQSGQRVILGGPMTGCVLTNATVPVTKAMSGLTILPETAVTGRTACIRCGRCAAVCPVGLRPYLQLLRRDRQAESRCLRCGACQYSCPAGQPLAQIMGGRRKEAAEIG